MFSNNLVLIPALFLSTVLLIFAFSGITKDAVDSAEEERMTADETDDEPNSKYYDAYEQDNEEEQDEQDQPIDEYTKENEALSSFFSSSDLKYHNGESSVL